MADNYAHFFFLFCIFLFCIFFGMHMVLNHCMTGKGINISKKKNHCLSVFLKNVFICSLRLI